MAPGRDHACQSSPLVPCLVLAVHSPVRSRPRRHARATDGQAGTVPDSLTHELVKTKLRIGFTFTL